jgi:integrase
MPRAYKRLTDRKIANTKTAARLADGDGLYLIVKNASSKHWVFEYQFRGKRHYMGLGSARTISLAKARELVAEFRKLKEGPKGKDPLTLKREDQRAQVLEDARAITFEQAATRYMDSNRVGWSDSHVQQWTSTLEDYAYPTLGHLPVQSIDKALVLRVLEPIWTQNNVTATRLRGRIETVLDWAKAMDMREGENPARWRGHLDKILQAPTKVHRVKNFESMPYGDVPTFMTELRQQKDVAAAALEFLILTAARKSEVCKMRWSEVDLKNAVWTVPAERMKKRLEHDVPLSRAALDILERMEKDRINEFVFFATIRGTKRISDAVFGRLMEAMGEAEAVPHGFRSSFRSWAGARTNFPREVAEAALAHVVGDKTERAYQRDNLIEKRRALMALWADYCAKPVPVAIDGDNVVELRA